MRKRRPPLPHPNHQLSTKEPCLWLKALHNTFSTILDGNSCTVAAPSLGVFVAASAPPPLSARYKKQLVGVDIGWGLSYLNTGAAILEATEFMKGTKGGGVWETPKLEPAEG